MSGANESDRSRATADELLADWERRSLLALLAHSRSANRCAAWDSRLGSAGVALTAAVGTSIFATLGHDVGVGPRIAVGVVTVTAAVCTALHTFATLRERKEIYEHASRLHATVRRQIEVTRARLAAGESFDVWADVERLRRELDGAAAATPNASRRIWDRTRREVKGQFTWWERLNVRLRGLPSPRPIGDTGDVGGPRLTIGARKGSEPTQSDSP